MPYIGIKDDNKYEDKDIYSYRGKSFKLTTQNDLFKLIFTPPLLWQQKPYEIATLSSIITLSNKTPEIKEVPIYFWYGFCGGGYTADGAGSHINCSEVTFTANHVE